MDEYSIWISNYNRPRDELSTYSEKSIATDYPSLAGKTVRVYVHDRASALEDIDRQLEELRARNRLRPGARLHLRDIFVEGRWDVQEDHVVRHPPD